MNKTENNIDYNSIPDDLIAIIRKNAIEEYYNACVEEMTEVYEFYKKDKKNVPKPDLTSAVVIMTLAKDGLKKK